MKLAESFETARSQERAVLVGYLPAGLPSVDGGIDALCALVDSGVDVLEIGLPYSDPVIDGPVIQTAVDRALAAGTTTADVLRTVEGVVTRTGAPALVMTYWNPVEQYGADRFARDLASAGGAGLITPDLTPEEAGPWLAAADRHGLDPVFLVAPSSTEARIRQITALCRGFVYATAVMGVTGVRASVSARAPELVARVRAVSDIPVGVGLGVSTGDQAAEIAAYADAVIVGSAFVRTVLDGRSVAELGAELAAGVRR